MVGSSIPLLTFVGFTRHVMDFTQIHQLGVVYEREREREREKRKKRKKVLQNIEVL
jgi:hypothetical protein